MYQNQYERYLKVFCIDRTPIVYYDFNEDSKEVIG